MSNPGFRIPRSVTSVLALLSVVTAGLPAFGGQPGLSAAWSVPAPPSARWASVHALPDGDGWLLCGWDTVWRVEGPGAVRPFIRSLADGGVLRNPLGLAVGPRSVLVYDRETMNFIEADRATGQPVGSVVFTRAGGVPYTGFAWNGTRWVLSGFMKDVSQAILEIQARDAGTWAFAGGTRLTPEERSVTSLLQTFGSVAAGPDGKTLLSFHALRRAIVVDEKGAELLSIDLPIPTGRALDPSAVKAPPMSEDENRAIFRGKSIPMGAGWMGGDPCVLMADLGSGEDALRWCRFSMRTGEPLGETRLALPSRDSGDWFAGAASTRAGRTKVAVLSRPWAPKGGKPVTTLHSFSIPAPLPGRAGR